MSFGMEVIINAFHHCGLPVKPYHLQKASPMKNVIGIEFLMRIGRDGAILPRGEWLHQYMDHHPHTKAIGAFYLLDGKVYSDSSTLKLIEVSTSIIRHIAIASAPRASKNPRSSAYLGLKTTLEKFNHRFRLGPVSLGTVTQ